MTTIAQHGEIHKHLHNMVKYTTITQHCEIPKCLHYIVKFTNNIKESRYATATVRTPVLVAFVLHHVAETVA